MSESASFDETIATENATEQNEYVFKETTQEQYDGFIRQQALKKYENHAYTDASGNVIGTIDFLMVGVNALKNNE